jgi:hypothetical protein
MNLDKALDILEVNNPSEIKIDDLKAIGRRAKKRWHPDTIAGLNPSAEKIKEYEENFKLVDEAIFVLETFINGTYHNPQSAFKGKEKPPQKSSEEVLREEAPAMQTTLKSIFEQVKKQKFMYSEVEVVLSEGDKVKDLMSDDLKQDIPFWAVLSYFYSGYIGFILLVVGFFLGMITGETTQNIISIIIVLYAVFQALVCFLSILPMSRFWLPEKLVEIMRSVLIFNTNLFSNFLFRVGSIWHFLYAIPRFFARIFFVFVYVLYQPFILIFGNRVVRRVVKKQAYYANYADWYIETLIHSKSTDLTTEELFDLGEIHKNLIRVSEN